jgi:D-alanine-D-alanine ligase-like ATP-grasp enzyme
VAHRPRRTAFWAGARVTNRVLLQKAYGGSYLSEYRRLAAQFYRRPKTVLNDIWVSAAAEVGAAWSGDWSGGFEFRLGKAQARVDQWDTHLDPPEAIRRGLDKPLVVARLSDACVAVPEQLSFTLREVGHAVACVRRDAGPWVVKPRAGSGGLGVTCGVEKPADLARAIVAAAAFGGDFVLERQIVGAVYRFLILDGELLDVVRRDPSSIEGDGVATIRDLIRSENHARADAAGSRGNRLVPPDHDSLLALRAQQIDLESVPPAGVRHPVKHSNGDGGRFDTHSVPLPLVSLELADDATRAANAVGVRLAGVDIVTPDLGRGINAAGGAVVEVNAPPALHYHYLTANAADAGQVAAPILRRLLES